MRRLIPLVVMTVVLLAGLGVYGVLAAGEPIPASPPRTATYTFLEAQTLVTGTTYSNPPLTSLSVNPAFVAGWNSADVFVSATFADEDTLAVKVQFSPDGSMWGDARYSTVDITGTVLTNLYSTELTTDTITYWRIPVVGEYMRIEFVTDAEIEAEAIVTLRNN